LSLHVALPIFVARVGLVADPDQGALQQLHHGSQRPLPGKAGPVEILVHRLANRRQRPTELDHPVVLVRVAHLAPTSVIAILLATTRVTTGGLQVTIGSGADPDILPGRWDRQLANPLQRFRVVHPAAIGAVIAETSAGTAPGQSGAVVIDVAQ